jgi:hypothetical protein
VPARASRKRYFSRKRTPPGVPPRYAAERAVGLPLPSECANPTDVLARNGKRTAVVYQYLEGCVQYLEGCELTVCPRPLVVATACCTCALQEAKRGSDVERLDTCCKVSALVNSLWKITLNGTFQFFFVCLDAWPGICRLFLCD